MKKIFFSSLCSIIPLLVSTQANADLKINGGTEAKVKEFPYFASLYLHSSTHWNTNDLSRRLGCGGVIIAGHYLLSAKHCFVENDIIGHPWWQDQLTGHQNPQDCNTSEQCKIINEDIIVGYETKKEQIPETYSQSIPISGKYSQWTNADWSSHFDMIILDLSKYIKQDIQLTKAIYLSDPALILKPIPAQVIGNGSTKCDTDEGCKFNSGNTDHLKKTNVSLDTQCSKLDFNQFPEPNTYSPHYSDKDDLACSTSISYNFSDKDNEFSEGYSNANHGDSGGPIIVVRNGNDFTYGVTHRSTLDGKKQTNKVVLYQTFSKEAIHVITQQINGWNAPTIVNVNVINKDYNVTIQNLTTDDVNLFNSNDLTASDNVTFNYDSNCNQLINPMGICQLTFTMNNEKSGYIKIGSKNKPLVINIINTAKNNDHNKDGGSGGSFGFLTLFALFGFSLIRKRLQ